jgi:hypothetical protein
MLLIQNGQARARIVLGQSATWLERHAAEELGRYLEAISGAKPRNMELSPKSGP